MPRYFFDSRDDGHTIVDEVRVELADLAVVKGVASKALAELAFDVLPGAERRTLGIDVRDDAGRPVLVTELTFEVRLLASPST
jgi:hypothetical protein